MDGRRIDAELAVISLGGAKLLMSRAARAGERLVMMVPGLPFELALVR